MSSAAVEAVRTGPKTPPSSHGALSAIMIIDAVGSPVSSNGTQITPQRQQNAVRAAIARHRGRAHEDFPRGMLSTFGSAVEAVRCAIEVQRALQADPPAPVSIGVHVAELVYDGDQVQGDGVKVAAGIQALSVPGSILISGAVLDEVKNHPDLATQSLGRFDIAPYRRRLDIHALTGSGLSLPHEETLRAHRTGNWRSVAVVPFANLSAEAEDEFLSSGITQDVINSLAHTCELQVLARTSSSAIKTDAEGIRTVAEELGVTHLVVGSVLGEVDRIRVAVRLVFAAEGHDIFAQTYDRDRTHLFDLQSEIAEGIRHALADHLCDIAPVADSELLRTGVAGQ